MEKRSAPKLALVVPCYNEEEVIKETIKQLSAILENLIATAAIQADSFIYFIDDGSQDKTWEIITEINRHNRFIKGLKLSRNFGHQNALLAGLLAVKDKIDCAISIDADLQQDINAIPEFLNKFRLGADIVYGIRYDRATDGRFKRMTALFFYKLMQIMGVKIIKNHADYRLMSKLALQAFAHYKEANLFIRGIVTDLGLRPDTVYFEVKARSAGESKYSLTKMLSFAIDGITSFSVVPLRIVALIGFLIFCLSLLASFYALIIKVWLGSAIPGWASTVLPIYFIGGVQVMCLGIIGEYIGKIYKEIKARPRYLIETELQANDS